LTEFIPNGNPERLPQFGEWTFDGEKVTFDVFTRSITFRDADRPELRTYGALPAVVMRVGDKLHFCFLNDSSGRELTDCAPGPGVTLYVFERVKDK
jgi:hypothetical protein